MAHWNLIIEDDTGKAMAVPLTRDEVTIGRKEGNTIRLTERNVSRFHARLRKLEGTKIHIEDLSSYNGIKINGDKISGQVEIREGDLIEIGDYHLALQSAGMAEPAAEPPPEPATAPAGAPSPLSLQTTQGAPAEVDDEFAGDTQRWEPPVGMEPVAVGMATVDDQAAIADGRLNPVQVSGIGSPTLDERPAISSAPPASTSQPTPGVLAQGGLAPGSLPPNGLPPGGPAAPIANGSEATVRNQSAPLLPAPGTPLGDISNDETEAVPVARSDGGPRVEPLGGPAGAAPVVAMSSLVGIEDEPTEAHPTSGSADAPSQDQLLPPPSDLLGSKPFGSGGPSATPMDQVNTLPEGAAPFDPAATLPPIKAPPIKAPPIKAQPPIKPLGAEGNAQSADGSSPPAMSPPAASPPASSPPAATSPAANLPPLGGASADVGGPANPPVSAQTGQPPPKPAAAKGPTNDGPVPGEYTDVVRAAPGPRKQMLDAPRLVVVNSVFAGSVYPLQAAELVIGRIEDNDITIDHRSVSRHHAKVVREGNGYRIVDLGSANGILLNGNETEGATLKSGDIIELGRIRVRFVPIGEAFDLSPEEIARARKADALGEDDFDDGAQTAFVNAQSMAPTAAEGGSGSTLVILVAAAMVIILLLLVIVFLLMRNPAAEVEEPTADPSPSVAVVDRDDQTKKPDATVIAKSKETTGTGVAENPEAAPASDPATDPKGTDTAQNTADATNEASETNAASTAAEKKKSDREAKAAAARRQANAARKKRVETLISRAKVDLMNGRTSQALAAAKEAVSLRPRDSSAHRLLGGIYRDKGDNKNAKKHLKEAVRLNPNASWVGFIQGKIDEL